MIINYDHNHSLLVMATVNMIVNYDRKTFIVQATDLNTLKCFAATFGFFWPA